MKKFLFILLSTFVYTNSIAGNSLKIANHTDSTFTFNINGHCSEQLGQISPHSITNLDTIIIAKACDYNTVKCFTQLHATHNCTEAPVAAVIFDSRIGVRGIDNYQRGYKLSYGLYRLEINRA